MEQIVVLISDNFLFEKLTCYTTPTTTDIIYDIYIVSNNCIRKLIIIEQYNQPIVYNGISV